ncbi:uncharacterized protein LOC144649989 [Oculina patagonica]
MAFSAFYGFALVMLVLCSSVNGDTPAPGNEKSTTAKPNITTPGTSSTTVKPTTNHSIATPTTHGNHSSVTPTTHGNRSTATPTAHGNHSTATPTAGNHSTATPTAHHGNQSTATPTATTRITTNKKPTPKAHGGDHHSDRGKWVATGFAVFFLITTIVMTVLYCRQRKIYRELEGDSSLSRLI